MRTRQRPGLSPLGNRARSSTDGEARFREAVEKKMKSGMSKAEATRAVVKGDHELQADYVRDHNERVGPSSFSGSSLD